MGLALHLDAHTVKGNYIYVDRIVRVYDGDTVYVDIDEWHPVIGKNLGIRIAGIQAPEIKGAPECEKQDAAAAQYAVVDFFATHDGKYIKNPKRGSFFRIVGDFVDNDGNSLKEYLLELGVVMPWDGKGKKPKWVCTIDRTE